MLEGSAVARLSCPTGQFGPEHLSGRQVCVECPAPTTTGVTITTVSEEAGVMKCTMSDNTRVDATQTSDPSSIEFVDPISVPASTAAQYVEPTFTDKPAAPDSCWSPTYLGSEHCWHDTENRGCGEGDPGCTCRCRKCPDGYSEDHSNPGTVRCSRCPPGLQNSGGMCFEQCPAGTAWKWQDTDSMFGCFQTVPGGDSLEFIRVMMSTTCPGGTVALGIPGGGVKCYTACPEDKPRLDTSWSAMAMVRRRLFHVTVGA